MKKRKETTSSQLSFLFLFLVKSMRKCKYTNIFWKKTPEIINFFTWIFLYSYFLVECLKEREKKRFSSAAAFPPPLSPPPQEGITQAAGKHLLLLSKKHTHTQKKCFLFFVSISDPRATDEEEEDEQQWRWRWPMAKILVIIFPSSGWIFPRSFSNIR